MTRVLHRPHPEEKHLLAPGTTSRPAPAAHLGRRRDRDRPVGFADVAALSDPEWASSAPGRYTVAGLVPAGQLAVVPLAVDPERALVAALASSAELLDMPLPGSDWAANLRAVLPAAVAQPNDAEHYREAEEWLTVAANAAGESVEERAIAAAVAQAHATLALAAATALHSTGVGEADLGEWSALICEPDDPYEGMTNADVMSGEELAEYDRDAEFALDAADEERYQEEAAASRYDDEHYDVDDDDADGDL